MSGHALAPVDDRAAHADEIARGWRLTSTGLEILRALTADEWRRCGARLLALTNSTAWAVGDWLVYGEGRGDYGATYDQMAEITGKSFESLSQYARVARAYPRGQRNHEVPWTHHRMALRLLPIDRQPALQLSAKNGWTVRELSGYIDTRQGMTLADWSEDPDARPLAEQRKIARWRPTRRRKHVHICPKCGHRIESRASQQVNRMEVT